MTKIKENLGSWLFSAGFIVMWVLLLMMSWASMEAAMYEYASVGSEVLSKSAMDPMDLECPAFISEGQGDEIFVNIKNKSDKEITPLVRATFSNQGVFRFEEIRPAIPAETTNSLRWDVSVDDRHFGYFVFAKVFILPEYQFKPQEGTCGMIVLPFQNIDGKTFIWISVIVSYIAMLGGWFLFRKNHELVSKRSVDTDRAMGFILLISVIGLLFASSGGWFPSGLIVMALLFLPFGIFYTPSSK